MEEMLMKKETEKINDIDKDDSLEKEVQALMEETEQSRRLADELLPEADKIDREAKEIIERAGVAEEIPESPVADKEDAKPEVKEDKIIVEEKVAPEAKSDDKLSFFKTEQWKKIWDTATTVLLIGVMATPILILGYIIWWFLSK